MGSFDPFATANLWHSNAPLPTTKEEEPLGLFSDIDFESRAPCTHHIFPVAEVLATELILPLLDHLEISEPEDSHTSASSSLISSSDASFAAPIPEDDEFDVWAAALHRSTSSLGGHLSSWEAFSDLDHVEPTSTYLSEACIEAFDAAIDIRTRGSAIGPKSGTAVQADPLLKAVLALAVGQSSLFFVWHEQRCEFSQVLDNTRIPGCTVEASQAVFDSAMRSGHSIKRLQTFCERAYGSSSTQPTIVALAGCVRAIISAVEIHLAGKIPGVRSFAQLPSLLRRPNSLLDMISGVVEAVERQREFDDDIASQLYEIMQDLDCRFVEARKILHCVLSNILMPCLDSVNSLIGLGKNLLQTSNIRTEPPQLPRFLDTALRNTILELAEALQVLRTHQPDHPLCDASRISVDAPQLEAKFDWHDVQRICSKAEAYEKTVSAAVVAYRPDRHYNLLPCDLLPVESSPGETYDWVGFAQQIEDTKSRAPSTFTLDVSDPLETVALAHLDQLADPNAYYLDPELILCPALYFSPIVTAQARLVNAAVVRLIVRSHQLTAHLTLQHEYHLLGNGSFVTRLTSALFDPARATTERRKGVMRTSESMGLRLGSRKTWPPASSELRLALMSILADCYHESSVPASFEDGSIPHAAVQGGNDIPGGLSFSIRQLPPVEADRCMDAGSLYALDFLRLQYTAPAPIGAIITSDTLDKYDSIFKALLRVQRMLFVVSRLPRRGIGGVGLAFRHEAWHFVASCAAYFFGTAVAEPWADFQTFLTNVEAVLKAEDQSVGLTKHVSYGLEDIREAHNKCLDRIIFSLLLRKRHVQVLSLLEEIFCIVLAFAKDPAGGAVADMRQEFSRKVSVFINVCHGLAGKQGQSERSSIERLLLALGASTH